MFKMRVKKYITVLPFRNDSKKRRGAAKSGSAAAFGKEISSCGAACGGAAETMTSSTVDSMTSVQF